MAIIPTMPHEDVGTLRGVKWPAIHPRDGSQIKVLIPPHCIRWARHKGIGGLYELYYCVPSSASGDF